MFALPSLSDRKSRHSFPAITMGDSALIFIRAKQITDHVTAMAERLTAASGHEVGFILDGRNQISVPASRPALVLTDKACSDLGLYCPPDFAWRCGDYGAYLARKQFPDADHIWLVDHDIRIAGPRSEFFQTFDRQTHIDFLACYYRRADTGWDWYFNASGRDVKTFRCLFSIVRLSARAIDRLFEKRIEQAKMPHRRKLHPNDEGFVATTLANEGFACADFNAYGRPFYNEKTVTLHMPLRGETFAPDVSTPTIFHPVLCGADYERGNTSARPKPKYGPAGAIKKELWRRINKVSRW